MWAGRSVLLFSWTATRFQEIKNRCHFALIKMQVHQRFELDYLRCLTHYPLSAGSWKLLSCCFDVWSRCKCKELDYLRCLTHYTLSAGSWRRFPPMLSWIPWLNFFSYFGSKYMFQCCPIVLTSFLPALLWWIRSNQNCMQFNSQTSHFPCQFLHCCYPRHRLTWIR